MKVGMAAIFQNPDRERPDLEVYQNDLRLACLAEPLGFDSVWSVEHHFTGYTMCPSPFQFLAYMAARTERIELGSMVVVLPWQDPLRVTEQVAMLDNMSNGRVILGIGRGAGRVEFEGFGQNMGESRERFVESAQMILRGLETGYCELDGTFIKQSRVPVRPAPFKSFKGRTYAAAVSPESTRIMAELGIGILVIPQKPWDDVEQELTSYRQIFREVNGADAPAPVAAGWVFCDKNPDRAYELARRYIGGYWATVLDHYEFGKDHLKTTKGYEYYGKMADRLQKHGDQSAIDFFMSLQIWGTPEQCYEKILSVSNRLGSSAFNGVFSYAGMPWAEAERNMRLFAGEVRPELQKLAPPEVRARRVA